MKLLVDHVDDLADGVTILVADMAVQLRVASPEVSRRLGDYLGSAPLTDAPASHRLVVDSDPRRPPDRHPDDDNDGFRVWWDGENQAVGIDDMIAVIGPTEGGIDVDGAAPGAACALVSLALVHFGAHAGYLPLHAAVIEDRLGCRYLALGPSGAGKSTVSGSALRGGWGIVADDTVFIRSVDGRLEAAGLPRSPTVPDEIIDAAPITASDLDRRNRRYLLRHPLRAGWGELVAVLGIVHGSDATSRIGPYARTACLEDLVAAGGLVIQDRRLLEANFPLMGSLARLPVRRLAVGRDVARRAESTYDALASLAVELGSHSAG